MLTRFAPSPTGFLHIGNVRTALICYLYARKVGGKFMLRMDDTDIERSREEYVDALKEDLSWLGITWDVFFRQSERLEAYNTAIKKLTAADRVYPCYETVEELEIKRKMQLGRGLPPVYDRESLRMSKEKKANLEKQGIKPHYRFRLENKNMQWVDEIRGNTIFEMTHTSDPILIRANGMYTYMLPSTVDDMDFGVTHILRGEDHVSNTAIQMQIFEALGGKIPTFAHNALIKTKEGKLSKRTGASTIRSLREAAIEPMAINSFLAKVGTCDPIDIRISLDELIKEFDISKFGRAPTMYALEDINRLNAKLLHILPFEQVKNHTGLDIDEQFWLAVRPNISSLRELKLWWAICNEDVAQMTEDLDFIKETGKLLPEGSWDENTWDIWIAAVKAKTGRKGKELFMPIRKTLTGLDHGPELKVLLPLIGRKKAIARLGGK